MLELPEIEDHSRATAPSVDRLKAPRIEVPNADEDLRMGRPSSWIDNFTTEKSASRTSPDEDQKQSEIKSSEIKSMKESDIAEDDNQDI